MLRAAQKPEGLARHAGLHTRCRSEGGPFFEPNGRARVLRGRGGAPASQTTRVGTPTRPRAPARTWPSPSPPSRNTKTEPSQDPSKRDANRAATSGRSRKAAAAGVGTLSASLMRAAIHLYRGAAMVVNGALCTRVRRAAGGGQGRQGVPLVAAQHQGDPCGKTQYPTLLGRARGPPTRSRAAVHHRRVPAHQRPPPGAPSAGRDSHTTPSDMMQPLPPIPPPHPSRLSHPASATVCARRGREGPGGAWGSTGVGLGGRLPQNVFRHHQPLAPNGLSRRCSPCPGVARGAACRRAVAAVKAALCVGAWRPGWGAAQGPSRPPLPVHDRQH